jgi:hypothetical protein
MDDHRIAHIRWSRQACLYCRAVLTVFEHQYFRTILVVMKPQHAGAIPEVPLSPCPGASLSVLFLWREEATMRRVRQKFAIGRKMAVSGHEHHIVAVRTVAAGTREHEQRGHDCERKDFQQAHRSATESFSHRLNSGFSSTGSGLLKIVCCWLTPVMHCGNFSALASELICTCQAATRNTPSV